MKQIRFNAARVAIQNITKSGLCEAVYTGPITAKAFETLRDEALQMAVSRSAFVCRFDQALMVMGNGPQIELDTYAPDSPAGAIIVRPDQYAICQDYALRAAKFGVVRTVWVEANARLAYEWALRRSCSRNAESPH